MELGEYIRNRSFAAVDMLRKDSIGGFLKELQDFDASGKPYEIVLKKLYAFLAGVQDSCVMYSSKKGVFNLEDYPVVQKRFLKENMEQMFSMTFKRRKLIPVTTSGSYGTPCTFYLTPQKKKRQLAEVIHFNAQAAYEVGLRHGYFRTNLPKMGVKLWLQNQVFISSKVLNQHFLESTRVLLKTRKIKVLIGFPSAIAFLASYCLDQGDKPEAFGIQGIITFAENLLAKQRDSIVKAFGCPVHSRYGTEELGVLGYQIDNDSGFALNNLNYIVEVLDLYRDVSVKPGEIGRVVITDLHSDALPLIRYDTGDLAQLGEVFKENSGWAKTLTTLSGRAVQFLYSTNGEKLYPLFIDLFMEESEDFVQYQIIQETACNFKLNLVPRHDFQADKFSAEALKDQLKGWLGKEAHIELCMVADIEALPSGKRPYIINKCDSDQHRFGVY